MLWKFLGIFSVAEEVLGDILSWGDMRLDLPVVLLYHFQTFRARGARI